MDEKLFFAAMAATGLRVIVIDEVNMTLDRRTFESIPQNERTHAELYQAALAADEYARALEGLLPEGPDKTYALRKLREVAMWVSVAITRNPDGSPRS